MPRETAYLSEVSKKMGALLVSSEEELLLSPLTLITQENVAKYHLLML